MFRFENPTFLWSFIAVPVLIALYVLARWLSLRAKKKFATDNAMTRLLNQWSPGKEMIRTVLLFVSIAMLCMSLANPQWGSRRQTVQAKAADIFIALDISNSMYVQDIAPSRLERAKKFATDLVNALRGERIGLILFAGNAYLQMPLTTDYAAAAIFIRSAHPGLATTQGTAIGEAIDLAMRAFTEDDGHNKALIIITDGENHEEGASDAMSRARTADLIPFLVAVGTEEGGLIPVVVQGREDYKRDENGNPVRSIVNEGFLKELAQEGNGTLYNIFDADFVIRDIKEKIDEFDKREMEQRAFRDFESYYQHFLLGGIVLLIVAWTLGEKRNIRNPNDLTT